MLRGGDVLRFGERCFNVGERLLVRRDLVAPPLVQVEVGSSMPAYGIAEVDNEAELDIDTAMEQGNRPSNSKDVVEDTPASKRRYAAVSNIKQQASPTSKSVRRRRGRSKGIDVDDNDDDDNDPEGQVQTAELLETQLKHETQASFELPHDQDASTDIHPHADSQAQQEDAAFPMSKLPFGVPQVPSLRSYTTGTEIPDSVPPYYPDSVEEDPILLVHQSGNDIHPPPKGGLAASGQTNQTEASRKLVVDSFQDNEEETVSEPGVEAEARATPQASLNQDVSPTTVTVVIPAQANKRKAEDDLDGSTPQNLKKRPKSTPKSATKPVASKVRTPSMTPQTQVVRQGTPNSRDPDASVSSKAGSTRSARSVPREIQPFVGEAPLVIFSNSIILDKPQHNKFIKKHCKVSVSNSEPFEILIVGRGNLKKTSKLLQAFACGASIVTDEWVHQSLKAGMLLSLESFLPKDVSSEKEWAIKLADVVGHDRRDLFAGKTFFITPALKKDYKTNYRDIEELLKLVGAKKVVSKPAKGLKIDMDTIVLGLENGDKDVASLAGTTKCYSKDFLSISIIRGTADLQSDEFQVGGQTKSTSKPHNSQPMKSATPTGNQMDQKVATDSEPKRKRGRPRKHA